MTLEGGGRRGFKEMVYGPEDWGYHRPENWIQGNAVTRVITVHQSNQRTLQIQNTLQSSNFKSNLDLYYKLSIEQLTLSSLNCCIL